MEEAVESTLLPEFSRFGIRSFVRSLFFPLSYIFDGSVIGCDAGGGGGGCVNDATPAPSLPSAPSRTSGLGVCQGGVAIDELNTLCAAAAAAFFIRKRTEEEK